nr:hypothetical protein [uncultured Methanobrevibacter sp.]
MMDKNKVIIAGLIIVIVALLVGLAFMMQEPPKDVSKLKITSNKTLYEGDALAAKLTDVNGTPLKNKNVSVVILDKKNKVVLNKSLQTNDKGKIKVDLDLKKGKYEVNISFGGDDKFNSTNTTQKLKIMGEVVETEPVEKQYLSSSHSSPYDGLPEVDSSGVTKEEAKKYGYTYTEEHGGHYIGSNDHWDENAGVYHD